MRLFLLILDTADSCPSTLHTPCRATTHTEPLIRHCCAKASPTIRFKPPRLFHSRRNPGVCQTKTGTEEGPTQRR